MKVEKLKKVLTEKELKLLKDLLKEESIKPKNKKYDLYFLIYEDDLPNIDFHEHIGNILYFIKGRKSKDIVKIKKKLKSIFSNRQFDVKQFVKELEKRPYKYKKKEYEGFLKKSQSFFARYKHPFDFVNFAKKDYLNRVYLGLGFEFLLKSIYLKEGYVINEIKTKGLKPPVRLKEVKIIDLKSRTKDFFYFIKYLPKILPEKYDHREIDYHIIAGLHIVRCWRNQDIHTPTHLFLTDNEKERKIKTAYKSLYLIFFPKVNPPRW